nr:tRNA uridine-5-carboxymethylaminomethyl(34) synthesis GTPase MnmE [Granulicella sp. dw_53]
MLLDEDTIVAVSTPPGRGGIGIVRLSGALARGIAEVLVTLTRPMVAGRARFGRLVDRVSGQVLDEAVVTYFAAPHSYTTEDVVEIAVHGSPALLEYVVRECCAGGARLAEPGEFTQRAFLRGRLDLTQAEAVDDLIQSQTLEQARVAAQQLGGALSRVVGPVKERLVGLIAGLEAGIDFAEDDIDVMPADEIVARVDEVVAPLEDLARSFSYGRVVREGFSLAIVGRPNAGKSSLFNRLVERERAIVTARPGTTRDLVTERISLEGIPVELIDTAGLRVAVEEAEALGIAKSREAMADADVVLVVVDASEGIGSEEESLIEGLGERAHLVVWNKSDLAPMSAGLEGVATSALTGEGIAELRQAILGVVTGGAIASSQGMITNLRQQQAVVAAIAALMRARGAVAGDVPHEMALLDLYEGLQALDSLTGATSSDDILHLIFSKFCIGK